MWARNLLFVAICVVGVLAIGDSLLRRQRIETPRDFQPGRFAATVRPAGASSELQKTWPAGQPTHDWASTLARLNGEFRADWKERGMQVAPRADDLTIARRLSLALAGTVPSVAEIRALEAVRADDRLEWWTSHLLADRRHADYLAERLARAYVGNENGPFIVYRRRRFGMWLADNLYRNTPYDEIVRGLLAEDGIWTGKPATNFITASADPNEDNQPDPIRLAGRTARAFLGMRIDCLQCHDDKLGNINLGPEDDIHSGTQADFHQLAAFFGSTEITLVGVRDGKDPYKVKYLDAEQESVVPAKVPFANELLPDQSQSDSGKNKAGNGRDELARWVTHPQNKPFARATVNRFWAMLFGRPLIEPIDDIPLYGDDYPPGLQLLADDFVAHGYDVRRLIRLMAACEPMLVDSRADFEITAEHEEHWAAFPLTRLRPEQMAGALIQSASLTTIDNEAHVVSRLTMFGQTNDFVERYGDMGEDEFTQRGGTIPQRLLMMNGELVRERTGENFAMNAATRIAALTQKPEKQVEIAFLATLTRRPTDDERQHFVARLADRTDRNRNQAMEDLYWSLINSTEFSWNH
ncbi:MAG: DUF1549 domain-containing protein [Pirellulaceae bacterium]